MAFSRSYSALASALLVGTLAFTGCGATNTEKAQEAAASASASAAQASLDGIQTLADDYLTAMTTSVDSATVRASFSTEEQTKVSEALGKIDEKTKDGITAAKLTEAIASLSQEEKDLLNKVFGAETHKAEPLIDYSNLNDDQKLALNFVDFALQLSLSTYSSGTDSADNKINTSELSLDGTRVEFPVAPIANLDLLGDNGKTFFNSIPAVYVDGTWKIDGEKYLQKIDELSSEL